MDFETASAGAELSPELYLFQHTYSKAVTDTETGDPTVGTASLASGQQSVATQAVFCGRQHSSVEETK